MTPIEAAEILNKSRLDRQVSLSHCLKIWLNIFSVENHDGSLIIAWANLGSLIEGSMKLFLSVWYKSYEQDINAIKKKNKIQKPDGLMIETLRLFFKKRIWGDEFDNIVYLIQKRRNSIHSFKDKDIGTKDEFFRSIRAYLNILRYINFRLPYPDEIYIPRETKDYFEEKFIINYSENTV